jgi:chaperonin cofactor prefoldin
VEGLPYIGAQKDKARECAQVPIKLYGLAQEFKENNPQVVIRVLDQNLPMIRDRIGKLDVQDDLISNFSHELDKLDDEGYQDRQAGLIKVQCWKYERMKEELTRQDKNEEMLRLEYNKLERQYRRLKRQKTWIIKGETNALTKDDATLLARTALMES